MTLNLAILDMSRRYPKAFSGGYGEWVINEKEISAVARTELVSRISIPSSLPAADVILSLSYIDDAYDKFGEITILTRDLLTLKNASAMLNPLRSGYFQFLNAALSNTQNHAMQITTGVRHNRIGERLFDLEIDDDLWFDSAKNESVEETRKREEARKENFPDD